MNNLTTRMHAVNGIVVEQRVTDGFINGTAMCVAHGKRLQHWFNNQATIDLIGALGSDLGIEPQSRNSGFETVKDFSTAYPELIVTRHGGASDGANTWLHPDLAIQLAQWCNPVFAIQVSRWVREWLISSQSVTQSDDSVGMMAVIRQEIKQLRGDVRALANLKRVAVSEHPGLGTLIDEYSKDELDTPVGLPNPFTYSEWALLTGNSGQLSLRRRVAEHVKALRQTKYLTRASNGHVEYQHSDLPAFKAALENIGTEHRK